MALKPDRDYNVVTDISHNWSELDAQNTQEKGGVASSESAGSGVGLGQADQVVQYAADPANQIPMGVLLQDVNPPLSTERDYINLHNMEVRPGDPVTLVRKGWVVTDQIIGSAPSAGDTAYLAASGNISTASGAGGVNPVVGRFETTQDSDGFARVYMDI